MLSTYENGKNARAMQARRAIVRPRMSSQSRCSSTRAPKLASAASAAPPHASVRPSVPPARAANGCSGKNAGRKSETGGPQVGS